MSATGCPHEPEVVQAVHCELWSEALTRHVAGCDHCQQTEVITSAMLGLDASDAAAPLPDPRAIWLKARLARRRAASRKIDTIVGTMQTVGAAAAVALAAFGLRTLWPRLRDLATAFEVPTTSGGDVSALLVLGATAAVLALLATWNHLLTSQR